MNEPRGYALMMGPYGWWVTQCTWRESDIKLFNSERVAMFDKRNDAIAFGLRVFGGGTRSSGYVV